MINQVKKKPQIIIPFLILILSLNYFIDMNLMSAAEELVEIEKDSWPLKVKEDMNVALLGTYGEYRYPGHSGHVRRRPNVLGGSCVLRREKTGHTFTP